MDNFPGLCIDYSPFHSERTFAAARVSIGDIARAEGTAGARAAESAVAAPVETVNRVVEDDVPGNYPR
jgi:hypothetical protein